ncbi:MAG: HlyD family efflux transporter periplasmic adaptor subunit [Planctomycetota bacterium]
MKAVRITIAILMSAALLGSGWVVIFRSEWLKPVAKAEEKEPDTDVPVHVAKVARATLHRYVDCFGSVGAAQLYSGGEPSTARIASPIAGVVTKVSCFIGQSVEKGAPLFDLDDRVARAEEAKSDAALSSANAALKSAQASLLKLQKSTRPEQIAIAEIALKKAKQATDFTAQNHERQKALAKDELSSAKQVEETASILAAAREDQTSAEKQVTLLKNSPPPEEIAEAEAKIAEAVAKIAEAEKAQAAARLQRTLLSVKSPIAATVVKLNLYPGESVDATAIIIELVDLNRLEISALVPSSDLKALKIGQSVNVFCAVPKTQVPEKDQDEDASGEKPAFNGTLSAFGHQVDPKTDLATVRVALPKNSGVQPGQLARLQITVEEHRDCLAIPEECVFRDKTGIDVIAVVEKDKSALQGVKRLLSENGLVEIVGTGGDEVKEGQLVVTAGTYGIPKEETKVHILADEKKSTAREKK